MMESIKSEEKYLTAKPRKRDATATSERLLRAALAEFCEKGYGSARTAAIAERAECNIRMLYHYFGNKEGIYAAALELVYAELRAKEEELDLSKVTPDKGINLLMKFTFDHMLNHEEFIKMVGIENVMQGRFLLKSKTVPLNAMPLVNSIKVLLHKGQSQGIFKKNVDPVQLYISILSLSFVHISNKHTLSITFGENITNAKWLKARRQHVCEMIAGFLKA